MSIEAHLDEPRSGVEGPLLSRRQLRITAPEASSSGKAMNAVVHDLSEDGLVLQTSAQLSVGERIKVILPVTSRAAIVVRKLNAFFACRFESRTGGEAGSAVRRRNGAQPASAALEGLSKPNDESDPVEAFGTRLRRIRKDKGISLIGLARLVNVSKPTVWKWETKNARPRQEKLKALASALEVPERELLFGTGPAAASTQEDVSAAQDASSLSDLIRICRVEIAELAGVSIGRVSITVDDWRL